MNDCYAKQGLNDGQPEVLGVQADMYEGFEQVIYGGPVVSSNTRKNCAEHYSYFSNV